MDHRRPAGRCSGAITFWHHAKADFDEDGHEDLAIVECSTACDPFPPEYDLEWHRFMVFLNRPETAALELLGTFPTGAVQDGRVWARDIDADGRSDLLFDTQASPSTTIPMTQSHVLRAVARDARGAATTTTKSVSCAPM